MLTGSLLFTGSFGQTLVHHDSKTRRKSASLHHKVNVRADQNKKFHKSVRPEDTSDRKKPILDRRSLLLTSVVSTGLSNLSLEQARAEEYVDIPSLRGKGYGKTVKIYPDYELLEGGLQVKELRIGEGEEAKIGDRVVVDWDAYAVSYYGRIIQAKNLAKGGAYEGNEEGFLRFTLGSEEIIPGVQQALAGMKAGGIRRVIIPPGPLTYPSEPKACKKIGPRPTTFGGQRTLDFVMCNDDGGIDKTLLFDVELLGIGQNAKARRAPGTWVVDLPGK